MLMPISSRIREMKKPLTITSTRYGSALALKSVKADGTMEFYAITDRGPNGDIPTYVKDGKKMSGKFFPTPNFTPSIGIIKVNPAKDRADIIASIPLKVNGKPSAANRFRRA